jgi:hypothetical protein
VCALNTLNSKCTDLLLGVGNVLIFFYIDWRSGIERVSFCGGLPSMWSSLESPTSDGSPSRELRPVGLHVVESVSRPGQKTMS